MDLETLKEMNIPYLAHIEIRSQNPSLRRKEVNQGFFEAISKGDVFSRLEYWDSREEAEQENSRPNYLFVSLVDDVKVLDPREL